MNLEGLMILVGADLHQEQKALIELKSPITPEEILLHLGLDLLNSLKSLMLLGNATLLQNCSPKYQGALPLLGMVT